MIKKINLFYTVYFEYVRSVDFLGLWHKYSSITELSNNEIFKET